jgi:hypothetical protein
MTDLTWQTWAQTREGEGGLSVLVGAADYFLVCVLGDCGELIHGAGGQGSGQDISLVGRVGRIAARPEMNRPTRGPSKEFSKEMNR